MQALRFQVRMGGAFIRLVETVNFMQVLILMAMRMTLFMPHKQESLYSINGVIRVDGWSTFNIRVTRIIVGILHLSTKGSPPVGSTVTKGEQIGLMGTTGSSTGVHLHFEVGVTQEGLGTESGTIDPEIYLEMTFGGGDGGGSNTENKKDSVYYLWLSGVLQGGV